MPNNTIWQLIHVLCILAHGGLIITAFAAFVMAGFRPVSQPEPLDMPLPFLPWAAVVIGTLGTMANAVLYKRMSDLQKPILDETNQARYINQNFTYIISIFANLLVFAADVAIAKVMTTRIRYAKTLVAPVTLAATAGFLALIAAFADISQLRGLHVQERRQGNIIVMDTSTDSYSDEISTEAAAAGLDGV